MKQVSKAIGRKRMLKMADFLDKLPRKKFNFNRPYSKELPSLKNGCGSAGCIIGWTPRVFPWLVKYSPRPTLFKQNINPLFEMSDSEILSYEDVGKRLFGLPITDSAHLFTPLEQEFLGLKQLDERATPKQAAKLLRSYVKKYMSE